MFLHRRGRPEEVGSDTGGGGLPLEQEPGAAQRIPKILARDKRWLPLQHSVQRYPTQRRAVDKASNDKRDAEKELLRLPMRSQTLAGPQRSDQGTAAASLRRLPGATPCSRCRCRPLEAAAALPGYFLCWRKSEEEEKSRFSSAPLQTLRIPIWGGAYPAEEEGLRRGGFSPSSPAGTIVRCRGAAGRQRKAFAWPCDTSCHRASDRLSAGSNHPAAGHKAMDIAGSFPKNAGRGRLWICLRPPSDRSAPAAPPDRRMVPFPVLRALLDLNVFGLGKALKPDLRFSGPCSSLQAVSKRREGPAPRDAAVSAFFSAT